MKSSTATLNVAEAAAHVGRHPEQGAVCRVSRWQRRSHNAFFSALNSREKFHPIPFETPLDNVDDVVFSDAVVVNVKKGFLSAAGDDDEMSTPRASKDACKKATLR